MLKEVNAVRWRVFLILLIAFLVTSPLWMLSSTSAHPIVLQSGNKSDRDVYGLTGPVRSIRTTTAKLIQKGEKLVEGEQALLETASFDINGNKIEGSYYPVPGATLTGKEKYQYDDKGNLIEAVLLKEDGSILNKEIYTYDFDQYGNWTKVITSVAVNRKGTWTIEMSEVTYRSIEYYKESLIASTKPALPSPTPVTNIGAKVDSSSSITAKSNKQVSEESKQTVAQSSEPNKKIENKIKAEDIDSLSGVKAVTDGIITNASKSKASADSMTVAPKPPAKPISTGALNSSAINLPVPLYPAIAKRTRAFGVVTVEVVIDEKGKVISARAVDGPSVFHQASVKAAYQAQFSPALIDNQPVKAVGIITYNFARPD
jgi:TonB family protein